MKPPPQAAPDARALAAAVQAFVDMTERWHEENGDLLVAQDGDLVGVYKHPPEYLAMKAALLPAAPPAETAELVALKAAARAYAKCRNAQNRDCIAIKALALVEAEGEAAGGGK